MKEKTAFLIVIIMGFYGFMLMHDPSEGIKMAGYNGLLKFYGDYQLQQDDTRILYNPGLRPLNIDLKQAVIKASLPNQTSSYYRQMENFLQSNGQVLVECSGLDSWHSSAEGIDCLPRLRAKAYRTVIFDGGHHLPTLGLWPDIIIVPEYKGYAVHGYMQDGIKVAKLVELLKASNSPSILVTVSRWRLVKTEASLTGITRQVLARLNIRTADAEPFKPQCRPRVSKYHDCIFVYINKDYAPSPAPVIKACRELGTEGVKKVYMAFDYGCINPDQAEKYSRNLQKKLGIKVQIVNEPLKTTDLMWP